MYLRTETGRQILDAVGGAGTVVLGHGVREITDAIARHGRLDLASAAGPGSAAPAAPVIRTARPERARRQAYEVLYGQWRRRGPGPASGR
jgi:hypothetical protein